MPKFKYTGEDARYYPMLPTEINPGDIVELDDDPGDGRWTQVSDRRKPTIDTESEPAAES